MYASATDAHTISRVYDRCQRLRTDSRGDLATHDNGYFRELRFTKPELSLGAGLAVV
jgi:hypothetical protein